MMKYNLVFLFILLFLPAPLLAQRAPAVLEETIRMQSDGSALISFLVIPAQEDSLVKVPWSFGAEAVPSVSLETSDIPVEYQMISGAAYDYLVLPSSPGDTLRIESTVAEFLDWGIAGPGEFGIYEGQVQFQNPMAEEIGAFSLTAVLPEGWNYHKIIGCSPKFGRKDPKPPYTLHESDGHASVTIVSKSTVGFAEDVSLEFQFREKRKPALLLIGLGLLLSAVYLIWFKELLAPLERGTIDK